MSCGDRVLVKSFGLRLLECVDSVADLASSLKMGRSTLEIVMRDGNPSSELLVKLASVLGKPFEEVGGWVLDYQFSNVGDRVDISEKDWDHRALEGSAIFCRKEVVRMDMAEESRRRVRAALDSLGGGAVHLEDVARLYWGYPTKKPGRLDTVAKFLRQVGWSWDPFVEKYVVVDPLEPLEGQDRLNYRVKKTLDLNAGVPYVTPQQVAVATYGKEVSARTLVNVCAALKACGWNYDPGRRVWVRP